MRGMHARFSTPARQQKCGLHPVTHDQAGIAASQNCWVKPYYRGMCGSMHTDVHTLWQLCACGRIAVLLSGGEECDMSHNNSAVSA